MHKCCYPTIFHLFFFNGFQSIWHFLIYWVDLFAAAHDFRVGPMTTEMKQRKLAVQRKRLKPTTSTCPEEVSYIYLIILLTGLGDGFHFFFGYTFMETFLKYLYKFFPWRRKVDFKHWLSKIWYSTIHSTTN